MYAYYMYIYAYDMYMRCKLVVLGLNMGNFGPNSRQFAWVK